MHVELMPQELKYCQHRAVVLLGIGVKYGLPDFRYGLLRSYLCSGSHKEMHLPGGSGFYLQLHLHRFNNDNRYARLHLCAFVYRITEHCTGNG